MTAGPDLLVSEETEAAPPAEDYIPWFQRFMERIGPLWTLGVLIIIVVIFGAVAPDLYTKAAWLATSNYAVEYLVLAIGQTYVIVTSGIDLADGATLGFSAMAGSILMQNLLASHAPALLTDVGGVALILASGAGIGLVNGLIITRVKLPPFIVTLGTLTAVTGATDLLNNATEVTNLPSFVSTLGTASILSGWLPIPVLITLALALVFGLVLSRTRFGLRTYAIGSNELAARRAGIKVDRHLIWVYTISGALSGVAAVTVMARFTVASPLAGANDELSAIAAVVIGGASLFGGRGTILGSIVGTAIVSVLVTGLVLANVVPFWQVVLVGAIIIAAVYIDQTRRRVRD